MGAAGCWALAGRRERVIRIVNHGNGKEYIELRSLTNVCKSFSDMSHNCTSQITNCI